MDLAIIGSGYVGLVTGACFADVGHNVICVDNDLQKIEALQAGKVPIYEPGLEEVIHRNVSAHRLRFTSSIREGVEKAQIIFIAVPTPQQPNGDVDLRFLEKVAREIAGLLTEYRVIVDKSTVPVKTGEKVAPIVVQTLDGKISEISYTNPTKKYLLFVLSTTCPHCEKALISWRTISQSNTAGKCDIIGVSLHNLDATRKYLATKDVGFYTVSAASDTSFSRKYRITGVPETILIKGNGSVEKVWIGELTQDQTNEIQKLMTA